LVAPCRIKLFENKFKQDYVYKGIEGGQNNEQTLYTPIKISNSLESKSLKTGEITATDLFIENITTLTAKNATIDDVSINKGTISNSVISNSSATLSDLTVTDNLSLPSYEPNGWKYDFNTGALMVNEIKANTIQIKDGENFVSVATNKKSDNIAFDYVQIGQMYLSSNNGQLQITTSIPTTYDKVVIEEV
jgi:hypothetical protein